MKILLTGASGFLGETILEELLRQKVKVIALSRKKRNSIKNCEFIKINLLKKNEIKKVLHKKNFDTVIDVAAIIPTQKKDNEKRYSNNFKMTKNLLDAIDPGMLKYAIKISTIDVYASKDGINRLNEKTKTKPTNGYAFSKLKSEALWSSWSKKNKTPLGILRSTQIFGEKDRTNKFIPTLIRASKNNKKFILKGDGNDKRDYLYVKDAAKIAVICAKKKINGIFNLSTGRQVSLNQIIKHVERHCMKKIILTKQIRKKGKRDFIVSNKKLLNKIGNYRFTQIYTALKKTYDYFV